jgi:hypothetical protein
MGSRTALAAYAALALCSVPAVGGSGMTITINNNTSSELLVTAYDLNSGSAQRVLSSEKINSFASMSVTINPDQFGRGHLSWTAVAGDRDAQTCGHDEDTGLSDGDTVHVYANSSC